MLKGLKWIIITCILIVLGINSAVAYNQFNNNDHDVSTHQPFQPTNEQMELGKAIVSKEFNRDSQNLVLFTSPDFILESSTAKFIINPDKQMITNVIYKNVKPVGNTTNITETEAHQKAINFIKEHFSQIDISNYEEKVGFQSNYVLKLQEIDKETGIKLLSSVTVIINQETGEIAQAHLDLIPSPTSLEVKLDKESARKLADEAVNNEFKEAKIIKSSDKPEVKLDREQNKQRLVWIFIYESEKTLDEPKHSAAIGVDAQNGDVIVQRAF